MIFLFKWVADKQPRATQSFQECDPSLFFANQVINNACATQALLSILMNCPLELGPDVSNLKAFSMQLPFKERGHAIGNCEPIRTWHNSFARNDPFVIEESNDKSGKAEDAFHFISYLPFNNKLYELDGLQKGPICYGECTPDTWLAQARDLIQKRIQLYEGTEIRFNLLALVKDKLERLREDISELKELKI